MTQRAAGRLPAAAAMLILPVCGMAIGLAIDCGVTPPGLLAALCAASSNSLAATLGFHLAMMPASYAMMAMGAILAALWNEADPGRDRGRSAAARFAAVGASVTGMLLGMLAGGWLAPDFAALLGAGPGFGTLVTGMIAGMAAATLAGAAVAHAATARLKPKPAQYIMYQ